MYVGGFLPDIPRQNFETVLTTMGEGYPGIVAAWAPSKLGNSGRLQFDTAEHLWGFLRGWKLTGKASTRLRYGQSLFVCWAAKEKAFERKVTDRSTRAVADIIAEAFPEQTRENDKWPQENLLLQSHRW